MSNFNLHLYTDTDYEQEDTEYGVASTVLRVRPSDSTSDNPQDHVFAIKIASTNKRFSREPHDVIKEIHVLLKLAHPNIVNILRAEFIEHEQSWQYWMHWLPIHLDDLLYSPFFIPRPPPLNIRHLIPGTNMTDVLREEIFEILAKSIIYQVILALNYLHTLPSPVAHRDIKPGNILLTHSGRVQLIDFGIAWSKDIPSGQSTESKPVWPESDNEMKLEVGTGCFRAPELIFGPKRYDAIATDLWSLGVTIAHFFTPIRLRNAANEFESEEDDEILDENAEVNDEDIEAKDRVHPSSSIILPKDLDVMSMEDAEWSRQSLFDPSRGVLAMFWEICKTRGTPNEENWPTFYDLPHAGIFPLRQVPPTDLSIRLPNLPSPIASLGSNHFPPTSQTPSALDLLHRLVVYPPERRMKSADALRHPWFHNGWPILLPVDHPGMEGEEGSYVRYWQDEKLGYWVDGMLLKEATWQ